MEWTPGRRSVCISDVSGPAPLTANVKRQTMSTEADNHRPFATAFGGVSLAAGVLEWLAILGCLTAARVFGPSEFTGYATVTMFASLPVLVFGVPLGFYGAWRGCRWVGLTGAALCLLAYAVGSFMLHNIVGNR